MAARECRHFVLQTNDSSGEPGDVHVVHHPRATEGDRAGNEKGYDVGDDRPEQCRESAED